MSVFLCGGGSGEQARKAYIKFSGMIDKNKPLLYIPLAMEREKYDECEAWIRSELQEYGIINISMVRDCSELYVINLDDYSAVFMGGGNTFKLLFELKMTGFFDKLKSYIKNDGVVFGGSAGAIVLGYDIKTCECEEENMIGLKDTKGLDVLNGVSILCHYRDRLPKQMEFNRTFIRALSDSMRVMAISEIHTIYVGKEGIKVIGPEPFSMFNNGVEDLNN